MATHTTHSLRALSFLPPSPLAPRDGTRSEAWEGKRAQLHHSESLWSHRHFYLLSITPKQPTRAQPRDVPHRVHPPADWLPRNFLETVTPLRNSCGWWLQPPPSSSSPQTPTSGEPCPPSSPHPLKDTERSSNSALCKPRPLPVCL